MDFSTYFWGLSIPERKAFAARLDTHPQYLYQIASGRRRAGAKILSRIGPASGFVVSPESLRPDLFRPEPASEPA